MKHVSPLLGYNNNVRHKNRVFHIQTEDSGIKHPHIITHLFMDGGRILKSVKRSYAEHVGADKMQDTVKAMMKEQHKAMFIALRDGQFDALLGDDPATKDAPKEKAKEKEKEKEKPKEVVSEPVLVTEAVKDGPPPKHSTAPAPPPPAPSSPVSPPAPSSPSISGGDDDEMVPMTTRNPPLEIDIEALERAAASPSGGLRPMNDMPPPPQNMFREKPASGGYRTAAPVAPEQYTKPRSSPPKKPASTPPVLAKKSASIPPKKSNSAPSEPRYAAARPAAIFGQARPQQGSSIFGEDLISDKSLDEVILSYLAEDLEPTKK